MYLGPTTRWWRPPLCLGRSQRRVSCRLHFWSLLFHRVCQWGFLPELLQALCCYRSSGTQTGHEFERHWWSCQDSLELSGMLGYRVGCPILWVSSRTASHLVWGYWPKLALWSFARGCLHLRIPLTTTCSKLSQTARQESKLKIVHQPKQLVNLLRSYSWQRGKLVAIETSRQIFQQPCKVYRMLTQMTSCSGTSIPSISV